MTILCGEDKKEAGEKRSAPEEKKLHQINSVLFMNPNRRVSKAAKKSLNLHFVIDADFRTH